MLLNHSVEFVIFTPKTQFDLLITVSPKPSYRIRRFQKPYSIYECYGSWHFIFHRQYNIYSSKIWSSNSSSTLFFFCSYSFTLLTARFEYQFSTFHKTNDYLFKTKNFYISCKFIINRTSFKMLYLDCALILKPKGKGGGRTLQAIRPSI